MRKILALVIIVLLLVLVATPLPALEGVGALADRLSAGGEVTLVGKTAPWAEVVVVDPVFGDEVVAVAEIESSGEFRFVFRMDNIRLSRLEMFGVDNVGITSRVLVVGVLSGEMILPPTIVNDETDVGTTNVALTGFTYPNSEVEVSLNNETGYNESFLVAADSEGKWVLDEDDLPAGEFTGTARSSFGGVVSELSQEIYFTIAAIQVPTVVTNVTETIIELLPTGVRELLQESPEGVARVLAPIAAVPIVGLWLKDIIALLLRMIFGLLHLLGWKKNRRSWGLVYDAVTKQPVSRSIVRLYQVAEKRLVETDVTGNEGVFAFLPQVGRYFIKVTKGGYQFPSALVKGSGRDGEYEYIYHGEEFEVKTPDEEIRLSIPIDSMEATVGWWFYTKRTLLWLWKLVGWVLLLFGLVVAVAALVKVASPLNVGVVGFYIALLLYQVREGLVTQRRWAVIKDVETGEAIANVSVALYEVEFNRLVQRRVSNERGRMLLVVPQGRYRLEVVAVDWMADLKTEKKGYKGEVLEVKEKKTKALKVRVWVKRKS